MICSLTRRFISRREDTGKPLPAGIERHLLRCPHCREFDGFCASLKAKAKTELEVASPADLARGGRILAALKTEAPRRAAGASPRRLVPVMALVGLLAVVVTVSVWLATPSRESLPRLGSVLNPERITALRAEIASVDLPLKQEKEALDEVLGATVKYLVSRLDPGLGK
jgi:predicted anti-sigma-YlaC factor YlaD